jgi:hypothetical protein
VCAPTVYGNDADLVMAEMNAMMGEDKPYDREVLVRNVYDPHQFPRRPFLLDAGAGAQPACSRLSSLPRLALGLWLPDDWEAEQVA